MVCLWVSRLLTNNAGTIDNDTIVIIHLFLYGEERRNKKVSDDEKAMMTTMIIFDDHGDDCATDWNPNSTIQIENHGSWKYMCMYVTTVIQ